MAALSLLTSGKYVIDPELRGAEFERITQNLDMQFWKSFWNLTESGLITVGRVKCIPTDKLPNFNIVTTLSPRLCLFPAGFQQNSLQSSAGELHPDSTPCHPAPSAGL